MKHRLISWVAYSSLALLIFLAVATVVIKNAGNLVVAAIEDHAVPYVLKTDDVAMGCEMAESLTLMIPGLAMINASPHKLAILFDFLSGSCSEFKAREEELRYLRAVYEKNVTAAKDARISQKRYLNQAALRQHKGYRNLLMAYPGILDDGCPDFQSWNDEFYWLVGLMDGLQAVLNDLASESIANVPLDISLKVARGAGCLKNENWWGLPEAIQAAIWLNFPSQKTQDVDSLQILERSVQVGLKQGIRVVQVVAAKIYIGLGDKEQIKKIIRQNVETRQQIPVDLRFLFLDKIAIIQLQAISDVMWTEATGMRTPIGGLGTFWDDNENTLDTVDIIDIL